MSTPLGYVRLTGPDSTTTGYTSIIGTAMSSARAVIRRVSSGRVLGPQALTDTPIRPYEIKRIPRGTGAQPGFALEPTWDSDRAVKEGLKVCAILATCLGRVAEKAASVPWYWWEEKRSGETRMVEPVEWLEYPRPDGKVSRASMMEEAHLHAALSGNALFGVLWVGGDRRIRPYQVQVENPHGCNPVPHRLDWIESYKWDDVAIYGPQRWDARDIVHVIGRKDPANRYWGWSIVEALAHTIDADVEARRANLKRFRVGGAPGTVVVDKSIADDETLEEREENLNRRARNRYGAFMVLGGDVDVQRQQVLTTKQLGLLDAMAHHRDEIAVACDFLPSMFDPSAATYDNVDHARRYEWQLAVLRNQRFADAFSTRMVERRLRGKRWISPYYGDVEELQDFRRKLDDTVKLVSECQVAVNDALAATGLPVPPQPGGHVALVPHTMIPATSAAEELGSD